LIKKIKMSILINVIGIQDSGGMTVLSKLFNELEDKSAYHFIVVCNKNKNIEILIEKYSSKKNFQFIVLKSKGLLYRLYYENIIFRKLIKDAKIDLVYNFSGSAQFFSKVPQLTKVHNLLFYSKKIDETYFLEQEYLKWIKQIFFKKIVFHTMLKQVKYLEVQSEHVRTYISDFLDISNKKFFIKSDINLFESEFYRPKNYDFSQKIKFFYVVGPHFEYLHKNFEDFVKAMAVIKKSQFNFEIVVTLTKEQLHNSKLWDKSLDEQTIFLGYVSKDDIQKQFQDNTILISTSVIETLGMHVIEAIQNGVLSIVPNEIYSKNVYGDDIFTYELFDIMSLVNKIDKITLLANDDVKNTILKKQHYIIENETKKCKNVADVFDEILKDENV